MLISRSEETEKVSFLVILRGRLLDNQEVQFLCPYVSRTLRFLLMTDFDSHLYIDIFRNRKIRREKEFYREVQKMEKSTKTKFFLSKESSSSMNF